VVSKLGGLLDRDRVIALAGERFLEFLDARRAGTLAEPDGVIEEDLAVAHVDEQWRQAVQVGEQR
jgi:hypothetical protein